MVHYNLVMCARIARWMAALTQGFHRDIEGLEGDNQVIYTMIQAHEESSYLHHDPSP